MHAAMVTTSRPHPFPVRVRFLCATNDYTWLAKASSGIARLRRLSNRHNDVGPIDQLLVDEALCALGTHQGYGVGFPMVKRHWIGGARDRP